ncbi:potassium channel family protein [Geodermatophilus sp. SYSU D01045]
MIDRLHAVRAADGYDRWQRRTDGPLLGLALLFLLILLLPLLVRLQPWQRSALNIISGLIWGVFAADYVVRLFLAPRRWRFARTHVLDLVVIALPMLRPLRALRLLRLLALVGLAHGRARRSLQARVSSYVVGAATVLIAVAAVAMREVEREATDANIQTMGDALWWAATTVTTVGYGDRYPTTSLGRLIAVALMIVGIALLGVITASVAAWFVDRLQAVREAEERTEATLADVLDELRQVRAELQELRQAPDSGRV